ncbi:MAG: hypothetical protein HEQ40_03015 [Lacibacter sp.]|jgi:hypothetical protein
MKRLSIIFLLSVIQFYIVQAQIKVSHRASLKKDTVQRNITPTPTKTVTPPPPLVYTLTAVKANIRTGNDNKEYPSFVRTYLKVRNTTTTAVFLQEKLRNEMKSNSNTEFGLEKTGIGSITLTEIQKDGLEFTIWYEANIHFDAWRIEGVSITLEFRDQLGQLHPTLGQKTITFNNATGFLNAFYERRMTCTTDGYLNPLSAQMSEY